MNWNEENEGHKVGIAHRNWRSFAQIDYNFDYTNMREESDIVKWSRNILPRLKESKSIERLNNFCSPQRSNQMNDKFKLIGTDLRKSLKSKIDGSLNLHKDKLGNIKRSRGIGFSLKWNPFLQNERKSNLSKFMDQEKLNKKVKKNCQTFIEMSPTKMKLTGTLKKILKNTQPNRRNRNNLSSLQSFLSTKNLLQEIPNDEEIKNKIKINQNKLRLDREIRELYSQETLLESIQLPEYPEYLGYYFRKWYKENTIVEETNDNISSISDNLISEWDNGIDNGNQWETHTEPQILKLDRNLDSPFLPSLPKEWLDIHNTHVIESLQEYQYLNDLKTPLNPPNILPEDKISPITDKKLLIFDMDETLIHCIPDPVPSQESHVKIPCHYQKGIKYKYVNLRPFVREWLLSLSAFYQIIVFTASTQDYADPILDYLDKDKMNNGNIVWIMFRWAIGDKEVLSKTLI